MSVLLVRAYVKEVLNQVMLSQVQRPAFFRQWEHSEQCVTELPVTS